MNKNIHFEELRKQVNILGRAEYRYDLLVTHFAENYMELLNSGYENPPDISILHLWLKELNFKIRPKLLESWSYEIEYSVS